MDSGEDKWLAMRKAEQKLQHQLFFATRMGDKKAVSDKLVELGKLSEDLKALKAERAPKKSS